MATIPGAAWTSLFDAWSSLEYYSAQAINWKGGGVALLDDSANTTGSGVMVQGLMA